MRFECAKTGSGLFQELWEVWDYYHLGWLSKKHESRIRNSRFFDDFVWLQEHTPHVSGDVFRTHQQGTLRTWWRPKASDHVAACFRMARLLADIGRPIRSIVSRNTPGTEVFRDSCQIVVFAPRPEPVGRVATRPTWDGRRSTIRYGSGKHWLHTQSSLIGAVRKPDVPIPYD